MVAIPVVGEKRVPRWGESSGGQAGREASGEVYQQVWDWTTLRSPSVLEEGEEVVGLVHAPNPIQVVWVPLWAVPPARVWWDLGTSQSEPPFSKKGKKQLWWPHAVAGSPTHGSGTWLRSYRERWLWIEKSSAPWCIIHGSVPKVGKKSCWWQKLQLRALFHPNGFWDQRVPNRTDNDIKGLL